MNVKRAAAQHCKQRTTKKKGGKSARSNAHFHEWNLNQSSAITERVVPTQQSENFLLVGSFCRFLASEFPPKKPQQLSLGRKPEETRLSFVFVFSSLSFLLSHRDPSNLPQNRLPFFLLLLAIYQDNKFFNFEKSSSSALLHSSHSRLAVWPPR